MGTIRFKLSNIFPFGPTSPNKVCTRPKTIRDTVFIFHRCARNICRVSRWTTSEISGMTSDWAKAVPLSTL